MMLLKIIRRHPEILFVIRAHPDEVREGKASRESVADWFKDNKLYRIKNMVFIPADKYISSYELIDRAKFVMVYNSTVGLEASLKEKPVLCAGKARYTQVPTVFLPVSKEEYIAKLETFIKSDSVNQKPDHRKNARRVLYSQLFRASLPLDEFLEEDQVWRGYVRIKPFSSDRFDKGESAVMDVIATAILDGKQVILDI